MFTKLKHTYTNMRVTRTIFLIKTKLNSNDLQGLLKAQQIYVTTQNQIINCLPQFVIIITLYFISSFSCLQYNALFRFFSICFLRNNFTTVSKISYFAYRSEGEQTKCKLYFTESVRELIRNVHRMGSIGFVLYQK